MANPTTTDPPASGATPPPGAGAGTARPGAGMGLASSPNLRDLGGWPTRDGGRVVSRAVYRSTDLSRLAGPDVQTFAALGIRTVFDLRTANERTAAPDVLPPGTDLRALDVLADSTMAVPANLMSLLSDPSAATDALGGNTVPDMFATAYREIVALPSALAGYRALFAGLALVEDRPALFHCTTGKDRTGWAAAALLLLLGVSADDVMAEYLITNDLLLPALDPMFEQFRARGGDPAVLIPVLGVQEQYLAVALDEMTSRFGSITGYFTDGLGLDAATIDTLREAFIEPAG